MTPDIREGIISTAQALGISPADLATAISYETGGTFNPTEAGPTTQWGQHRGLIQFGEPQAQQYGVNWEDPVGSQLGPDGAIAKYLRDAGVQPGMGMMDIYSAINAGKVGRYGASDANNGGAPGTVADKVNMQMAGHRAKAEAFLGGKYPSSGGADSGQAANPYTRLAMAYASGRMTPEDAAIYEKGMAEGVFPKASKGGQGQPEKPTPPPSPFDVYAANAPKQQMPLQLQPLQAMAVQNATPLQRFPGI